MRSHISLTPVLMIGCALTLCVPSGAEAQSGLLRRAASAATGTSLGRTVSGVATQVQMIGAAEFSVEDRGLATVSVGTLTFGIARVEIKNGEGVRLHAYLLNPGATDVSVPVPDGELFVLVDSRGRRLERVDGPEVEGVAADAPAVTVPALERKGLVLLFARPQSDGPTATLKVGTLGMISGVPVHTSAAAAGAGDAPGPSNVWAGGQAAGGGQAPSQPPTP